MSESHRTRSRLHQPVADYRRRSLAGVDNLNEHAVEVIATRLRLLAHPVRLHILRALHARDHGERELAEQLVQTEAAVRSHCRLLVAGGLLSRRDDGRLHLADWPSWWLIQQLASGMAVESRRLRDDATRGGAR